MQGAPGVGNNEQQNVMHREAIETGGKLFVSINGFRCAVRSLLMNEKKKEKKTPFKTWTLFTRESFCRALIQRYR